MTTTTKRVLVTGANKGIGKAIVAAILAAREDAHVLLGSRSAERGNEARAELLEEHPNWEGRLDVLQIDVADDDSVAAAAQKVRSRGESLYGIVNNAGIGFGEDMPTILNVNTRGPRRVCEAFLPLLDSDAGRIVNISSASGPMFVAGCGPARQKMLTAPDVSWPQVEALMNECLQIDESGGDFESAGLGEGSAYGLSKACLNAYTIELARENPNLVINACTPGFIETDLTRKMAKERGVDPKDMGMKQPEEATRAPMRLLFGDPGGSGWYFGSDAERSPLDRYRSPGDPPYTGD